MASSSSSGLTFKLHPLVIVNISDHYTRVKSQMNPTLAPHNNAPNGGDGVVSSLPPRVYGCVIGVQKGRTVEIFNSFELLYDPSTHSLDRPFLEKKQELYKKVFPHFYILGWYSTGSDAQESDMHIHKALMDINESPVYVLLNPSINHSQKDLPVSIFESELHVIDGNPQLIFVRSSYTIETVEAERISVDHVAHLKPSDGGSAATQLAAHLTGIHSAIKMLHSRIKVLHHYLLAMQKGDVPCENSLLRQVSSLLRRLPAIESGKFQDDFLMDRKTREVNLEIGKEIWESPGLLNSWELFVVSKNGEENSCRTQGRMQGDANIWWRSLLVANNVEQHFKAMGILEEKIQRTIQPGFDPDIPIWVQDEDMEYWELENGRDNEVLKDEGETDLHDSGTRMEQTSDYHRTVGFMWDGQPTTTNSDEAGDISAAGHVFLVGTAGRKGSSAKEQLKSEFGPAAHPFNILSPCLRAVKIGQEVGDKSQAPETTGYSCLSASHTKVTAIVEVEGLVLLWQREKGDLANARTIELAMTWDAGGTVFSAATSYSHLADKQLVAWLRPENEGLVGKAGLGQNYPGDKRIIRKVNALYNSISVVTRGCNAMIAVLSRAINNYDYEQPYSQ
ncbi:Rpn11/EIF3F, C-terminal [Sesbania bispinosa]|nr:Rpn11/EIF3F, C-terminal [Sesbania bispinosa]